LPKTRILDLRRRRFSCCASSNNSEEGYDSRDTIYDKRATIIFLCGSVVVTKKLYETFEEGMTKGTKERVK